MHVAGASAIVCDICLSSSSSLSQLSPRDASSYLGRCETVSPASPANRVLTPALIGIDTAASATDDEQRIYHGNLRRETLIAFDWHFTKSLIFEEMCK